jgi:hypothetical protein
MMSVGQKSIRRWQQRNRTLPIKLTEGFIDEGGAALAGRIVSAKKCKSGVQKPSSEEKCWAACW